MKLSLASVDVSVLWMLSVSVPAAIAFWWCKRFRKTVAVTIAVAALLMVVGVPSWRDALASIATTPKALAVMLIPFGVTAALFGVHLHSIRKQRTPKADPKADPRAAIVPAATQPAAVRGVEYHHRWTIILGIIAGTTGGMILLDGVNVLRNLSKAPGGTVSAWSIASKQVTNGHAAQVATAGSVPPMAVIGIGIILLIGLAYAMGRHPHVRADSRPRTPRKGQQALPGGRTPTPIGAGTPSGGPPARLGAK